MKTFTLKIILCILTLLLTTTAWAASALTPFDPQTAPEKPDYAEETNWLSIPASPDQYAVDIFWVYPTILADDTHWLMPPANTKLRQAAQQTIAKQASVFTGQANLYAPLYRQMNMAALSLPQKDQNALAEYGANDVRRALGYYLKHHNNGRPFILAGHSQGSNILTDFAVEKWGTLGVERKLIAAYIIGWSITRDDLAKNPNLKMCENGSQTNCFISYNTVAAGRQDVAPTIRKDAVVTNPLTWAINDTRAPALLNLGATFFAPDGSSQTFPHFTSAQALDDGLVVEPTDPTLVDSGSATFPQGVYHVFDYSLFYENLKANAAQRIEAFLTQ